MCRQLYQMTSVVLDVSSVVPDDTSGVRCVVSLPDHIISGVSCTRWVIGSIRWVMSGTRWSPEVPDGVVVSDNFTPRKLRARVQQRKKKRRKEKEGEKRREKKEERTPPPPPQLNRPEAVAT